MRAKNDNGDEMSIVCANNVFIFDDDGIIMEVATETEAEELLKDWGYEYA